MLAQIPLQLPGDHPPAPRRSLIQWTHTRTTTAPYDDLSQAMLRGPAAGAQGGRHLGLIKDVLGDTYLLDVPCIWGSAKPAASGVTIVSDEDVRKGATHSDAVQRHLLAADIHEPDKPEQTVEATALKSRSAPCSPRASTAHHRRRCIGQLYGSRRLPRHRQLPRDGRRRAGRARPSRAASHPRFVKFLDKIMPRQGVLLRSDTGPCYIIRIIINMDRYHNHYARNQKHYIIAHADHGKTTLVDQILRQTNIFRDNEARADCF